MTLADRDLTDRLFLAVPLTPAAATAIGRHLAHLPALPGRHVPAANLHLTLRFLGRLARPLADAITRQLEAAPLGSPFEVRFGALGAFPRPARASVLWLGVAEGADRLHDLAGTVAAAVQRAGAPAEPRPFAAHLTLARLRPPADVRPLIGSARAADVAQPVTEVVLYRSVPTGPGTSYEAVRRFTLP